MPNLTAVLQEEIRRLARKEIRAETAMLKKQSAKHRKDLAALKRENTKLLRTVTALEKLVKNGKGATAPSTDGPPTGTRFSTKSLRSQRKRAGLSQAEYATLVGVSTLTMNNWENGKTRPGPQHLAAIVDLRGMGKRDAQRRLEELE